MSTTVWQRLKTGGKTGFDKGWKALDKLGAPVNKLSNKLGSEAFWPTTLDKESDKAARILKSFCKDGFYVEEEIQPVDGPKLKQKVVKKIPEEVIRNAKGLAIFTTMRTGLWISGAGGSGVLIAKKADGTWSPPSGIMLHTAGLGFLVGVDIYDCVLVLNTEQAVAAFTKIRCTLGGEISVVAGPVGIGGMLETEIHKRQAPIFTYLKSRGFYAGIQIDGTIVIERVDENERFYGQELPVKDILAGKVRHPPYEVNRLMETIKAAQGDTNYDETMIPDEPPPGDYEIEDGNLFGVPDKDDPDPYGVLALEKEGMSLKEAGTQKRASWEQFSFNPSPTSPVHSMFPSRRSQDGGSRTMSNRNSWRNTLNSESKTPSSLRNSMDINSIASAKSVRSPVMADSATQTNFPDDLPLPSSQRASIRSRQSRHSSKGSSSGIPHMIPEDGLINQESNEIKPTESSEHTDSETPNLNANNGYSTPPVTPPAVSKVENDANLDHAVDDDEDDDLDADDEYDDDLQIIEEPVVHSIQAMQATSSQALPGARLVEVPKRLPPKLPPRNPNRSSPRRNNNVSPVADETQSLAISPAERPPSTILPEPSPLVSELDSVADRETIGNTASNSETEDTKPDSAELQIQEQSRLDDSTQIHEAGKEAQQAEGVEMPGGFN